MQSFAIPGWVWVNLVVLIAAAVFVGIRLAITGKTGQHEAELNPTSSNLGRAAE